MDDVADSGTRISQCERENTQTPRFEAVRDEPDPKLTDSKSNSSSIGTAA